MNLRWPYHCIVAPVDQVVIVPYHVRPVETKSAQFTVGHHKKHEKIR